MGFLNSLGASVKAAAAVSAVGVATTPFSNIGGSSGGAGMGWMPSRANGKAHGALMGDGLQNGVVAACASAITEGFTAAPIALERKVLDKWQRVDNHPLTDLLERANDHYGSGHLWEATLEEEIDDGNGFWRVVWNRARTIPVELWWEKKMWPRYNSGAFIGGYWMRVDGKPYPLAAAAVYDPRTAERLDSAIHFRYKIDRRNPRWGASPLSTVVEEIVGDNAAGAHETSVLLNGAAASLFVTFKEGQGESWTPRQLEEFLTAIERRLQGTGAGRIAGSNLPVDVQKVSYSPEEMALDKLKSGYEMRICANLKVPAMVIGLASGADHKTYSNYEEAIYDFWTRTIIPKQERKGTELETQLFKLFGMDRSEWRIVWDRSEIKVLQEDEDKLYKRLVNASGGPILRPNEAREKIGRAPVPEGNELRTKDSGTGFDDQSADVAAVKAALLSADENPFTPDEIAEMVERRTPAMRALLGAMAANA